MPQREQEIVMLRRELEMLMGERQTLLRVVGATAALIASLNSTALPVCAVEAADPATTIARHLPARPKGRTVVIGAGKAAAPYDPAAYNARLVRQKSSPGPWGS